LMTSSSIRTSTKFILKEIDAPDFLEMILYMLQNILFFCSDSEIGVIKTINDKIMT